MLVRSWRRFPSLLAACAAVLLPVAAAAAGPLSGAGYTLGRGLRLPALDFTLSGYTSLVARNPENEDARLDLRDLSLFGIWEPGPRWRFFTELEVEHLLLLDDAGLRQDDIELEVERVYVDYAATPGATLRVGRYLTPFGRWNQLHADPLVWTVSRPLVTQLAIPDHAGGVALLGTRAAGSRTLDWTAWVDDSADFDPKYGDADFEDLETTGTAGLTNNFHRGAGGQLRWHLLDDRAEIAASYAGFEFARTGELMHAVGVDGLLRWRRLEVSGEAAWRDNGDAGSGDDWGAFAQVVVRLVGQVYGIARGEHYRSGLLDRAASRTTLGLGWRPLPPLNLKLEYGASDDRRLSPDGVQQRRYLDELARHDWPDFPCAAPRALQESL
jgi:hypothetical protein